eukprot:2252512-Alexandrium_andersonii.AAC.1
MRGAVRSRGRRVFARPQLCWRKVPHGDRDVLAGLNVVPVALAGAALVVACCHIRSAPGLEPERRLQPEPGDLCLVLGQARD